SRSGRSLHISAPARSSRSARQPNAWTEDPDEHGGDDECRDNPRRLELEYARDPPWFLHVRREDSRNEKQSKRQPERRADARDEDQLAPDRIERAAEQKQDAASEVRDEDYSAKVGDRRVAVRNPRRRRSCGDTDGRRIGDDANGDDEQTPRPRGTSSRDHGGPIAAVEQTGKHDIPAVHHADDAEQP